MASPPAPAAAAVRGTRTPGEATRSRFRPDIEGMRSVAVLLVVLYHAGVPGVSGGYVGVDVFFVLSGFLITGLLVSEVRRTGTVSLSRFYARRARRLLPMAVLVLVATAAAGALLLPPLDVPGLGSDVLAAGLYVANWHYAVGSTDYLGGGSDGSPVLHFWSLGVEEQFYVVWPLLLLLVVAVTRRGGRDGRALVPRIGLGLVVLGAVSLLLSWWLTPTTGSWAYFGLHTRAWELAAGAGAAIGLPLLRRLPRPVAAAAGWVGLVAVVGSALVYDDSTVFPGTAALVPVLGTVLLVAAGAPERARGTASLFSAPLLRYVGRVSYSWYLWHWPCLVLARLLTDGSPTAVQTAGAVVVSFLLAAGSHALVEEPVRRSPWLSASTPRSLRLGAALTALVTAVALALSPWQAWGSRDGDAVDLAVLEGSVSGPEGSATWQGAPLMSALQAREDQSRPDACYVSYSETSPPPEDVCRLVDGDGPAVALLGDSHSAHWLPAMEALARERGWSLVYYGKSACPTVDATVWQDQLERGYTECDTWRDGVLDRLADGPELDAVFVARSQTYAEKLLDGQGARLDRASSSPVWEEAARRTFPALEQVADRVVVVEDTPWAPFDVPACLSEVPAADWQTCDFDRTDRVDVDQALVDAEKAADPEDRVQFLETTSFLCPDTRETCPVVAANGGVVYADSSHLTNSVSRSLRDLLGSAVDDLDDPGRLSATS
ncbi:acyltransferase family protein [Pseudokineococcus basanitobsidens]|uniref:Acyltransferase family protein n=1 Tax=Pseudokineococcus basanitobsidens TaxID=1926649 RepID=A0ABU8RNF6_9ACTN